jgi:hypothetical protein
MRKLEKHARKELSGLGGMNRAGIVTTSVILPVIIAVTVGLHGKFNDEGLVVFWIIVLAASLMQIVLIWLNLRSAQLVQEAYFETQDLEDKVAAFEDENRNLRSALFYMSTLVESVIAWRNMQTKFFADGVDTNEKFCNARNELMSIILERVTILQIDHDELWNFAIYIHDPCDNMLKCIWREKHSRHPAKGPGRHWAPGRGHIGLAFARCEPLVTGDATMSDVHALVGAPGGAGKSYDNTIYRSFASVPIGPVKEGELPFGVLAATSNRVDRFDRGNALIIRHAAAELANLIHFNKIPRAILLGAHAPSSVGN